jgi:hypothetical protein
MLAEGSVTPFIGNLLNGIDFTLSGRWSSCYLYSRSFSLPITVMITNKVINGKVRWMKWLRYNRING